MEVSRVVGNFFHAETSTGSKNILYEIVLTKDKNEMIKNTSIGRTMYPILIIYMNPSFELILR